MNQKPAAGWDVGERPRVPMPYIVLPQYQYVKAHSRHEDGRYSSRPEPRDPTTRKRREWQRREGQGWASKLHHLTLDYRTVDELGLKPEELVLPRRPATVQDRLRVVDNAKDFEGNNKMGAPAHLLESGKKMSGAVKQFQYEYYKIVVPHRNVTLRVTVETVSGDPDVFMCST